MLAAVVKGTTFTVIVSEDRSAVQVIEGAVEVSAVQGGMARLVEGGKTVFIAKDNPSSLITADGATLQKTSATPGTAVKLGGTGEVDLATVANLTDGLVRADLTVAPTKAVATIAPAVLRVRRCNQGCLRRCTRVTETTAINTVVTVATKRPRGSRPCPDRSGDDRRPGHGTVVPAVTNVTTAVLGPMSPP